MGEKSINSWLCLIAVSMNLFVTKQITLFGLEVTATDSLAISYMLGLNMIQEYYGRSAARQHAILAIILCLGFTVISNLHLCFIPNQFDCSHESYKIILSPMWRIVAASITSFFLVQLLDIALFSYLKEKLSGKFFARRVTISLIFSQILDTFVFSFLGLYGIVQNISEVIIFSLLVKLIIIILSTPFAFLSKIWMSSSVCKPKECNDLGVK
jgi:uncharacterized integral membrane protein (TIGR00697 family)